MFGLFKRKAPAQITEPRKASYFSTHAESAEGFDVDSVLINLKRQQPLFVGEYAQDDSSDGYPQFKVYGGGINSVSDVLVQWYASQGFIGYQLCGILAQNWLINKVCAMPGDDAIRKGYNIVSTNGEEIEPEVAAILKRYDKAYRVNWHLREFIRKGRIFGIRIAMFKVESTDPEYYQKKFNIDGIEPGSYKGIVQIDPYWTAPMLDQASASQPDTLHFYEPTYWMINGKQVHRSHLIIFRHAEPVDVLKPQYLYGGVPLSQQIMERVYAAERTANEAPQLAESKRTTVWLTDLSKAMSDTSKTQALLEQWAYFRNNYGIKLGDKEGDEYQQFETSLADFDALIMTQYQLVAAQSGVPATKLLGTSPKGFNATGEYEEAAYHEMLESIQTHDLTPLLERHHALVLKSFGPQGEGVETAIHWNPLDTPTAKELAETNYQKAQTGLILVQSGAIDGEDERQRIAMDKTSGYNEMGLTDRAPDELDDPEENDFSDSVDEQENESAALDGEHWITTESGSHILIDENGTVIGGAGGKLNGQKFNPTSKSQNRINEKTSSFNDPGFKPHEPAPQTNSAEPRGQGGNAEGETKTSHPALREGHHELSSPQKISRETEKAYGVETPGYAEAKERARYDVKELSSSQIDLLRNGNSLTWLPKSHASAHEGHVIGMSPWLAHKQGFSTKESMQRREQAFESGKAKYAGLLARAKAAGVPGVRERMKTETIKQKMRDHGLTVDSVSDEENIALDWMAGAFDEE